MKLRFCQETQRKKICINHFLADDILCVEKAILMSDVENAFMENESYSFGNVGM